MWKQHLVQSTHQNLNPAVHADGIVRPCPAALIAFDCPVDLCCDCPSDCCSPCDACCFDCRDGKKKSESSSASAPALQSIQDPHVGSFAVVASPMRPYGTIMIGDHEFPAKAETGQADEGDQVKLIRKEAFGYVVRQVDQQ